MNRRIKLEVELPEIAEDYPEMEDLLAGNITNAIAMSCGINKKDLVAFNIEDETAKESNNIKIKIVNTGWDRAVKCTQCGYVHHFSQRESRYDESFRETRYFCPQCGEETIYSITE